MQDKMDILKEVGSIAAAHGSIALSKVLKRKIVLEVPKVAIVSSASLANSVALERIGIAVYSKIITGFDGRVIFLLDEKNAFQFNDISYKIEPEEKRASVFTEMGMSLIKEIGSIVTSSFATAISMMFKKVIILSAPMLISGTMHEILNITIFTNTQNDEVLLIETVFEEVEEQIKGSFYFVLTADAAMALLKDCESMLDQNKR